MSYNNQCMDEPCYGGFIAVQEIIKPKTVENTSTLVEKVKELPIITHERNSFRMTYKNLRSYIGKKNAISKVRSIRAEALVLQHRNYVLH